MKDKCRLAESKQRLRTFGISQLFLAPSFYVLGVASVKSLLLSTIIHDPEGLFAFAALSAFLGIFSLIGSRDCT